MKQIVSISLGSSTRDKSVDVELLGESLRIQRIGTNGSMDRFAELMEEWDGHADCLCLGGLDLYLVCGGRQYTFRQARALAKHATRTPVVDGSGLKNTLERETIHRLHKDRTVKLVDQHILLVSGIDRFGMAEALHEMDCELAFGDLAFSLGVGVAIKSWLMLNIVGFLLLPIVTRLPIQWLYPTGKAQEEISPKFFNLYDWADIIAGDFHFIRRHLPDNLSNKGIITNTTTADDLELLRSRNLDWLVTTTPEFEGRSFGTNVMEGVCVALLDKSTAEVTTDDYLNILQQLKWTPRFVTLT